jgi:hypothetical protein
LYIEPGATADWRDHPAAETEISVEELYGGGGDPQAWTLERARHCVLDRAQTLQAEFAQTRAYLYGLLNRGKVATAWQKFREDHPHEVLRHMLEASSRELMGLPWEIAEKLPRTLARAHPFLRRDRDFATPLRKDRWPLRVLLVIGSRDPKLRAEEEAAAIEDALLDLGCAVYLEKLILPERKLLRDTMADIHPHVLHFVGHGRKQETEGEEGALTIEAPTNTWD